jgi:hypothetical protein
LKYVAPQEERIRKGLYQRVPLESLEAWDTLMGFQFETLVLDCLGLIIDRLGLRNRAILNAGPYAQRQTQRRQACQIDLLIRTRQAIYICEMKFRRQITAVRHRRSARKSRPTQIARHPSPSAPSSSTPANLTPPSPHPTTSITSSTRTIGFVPNHLHLLSDQYPISPMNNTKLLEELEPKTKPLIEAYVDSDGSRLPHTQKRWLEDWEPHRLGKALGDLEVWDAEARLCATFLFQAATQTGDYAYINRFQNHRAELLDIAAEMESPPKPADLAKAILGNYLSDAKFADASTAGRPFVSAFTNFAWEHWDWSSPVQNRSGWLRALARWQPQKLAENLAQHPAAFTAIMQTPAGGEIFEETDQVDELLITWAEKELTVPPAKPSGWSSAPSGRCLAFFNVKILSGLRSGKYHDLVLRLAVLPEFSWSEHAVEVLLRDRPEIVLKTVEAGYNQQTPWDFSAMPTAN